MPGYKGHIAGGLAVYGVTLYVLRCWLQPTPLAAAEWLLFTLVGSLFPDVDVKSKGQNIFYMILLAIFAALLLRGQFEVVAILGVLSLIPMVVRHRGLFHQLWFIVAFALALVLVCSFSTAISCRILFLDALFFVLGALSHLLLDLGFKGVFGSKK